MDEAQAIAIAEQLVREHGLEGRCIIRVNRRLRTCEGRTLYHRDTGEFTIDLGLWHLLRDEDCWIRDTILHEIAHCLFRLRYSEEPEFWINEQNQSHSRRWRDIANEIGAQTEMYEPAKMS